mgnify:CR=1 FL=1
MFADNLRHGQGTIYFPDGSSYAGRFKNGKAVDQGVVTRPDGTKVPGPLNIE